MQKQNIKPFHKLFVLGFSLIFVSQFLFSCVYTDQIFNKSSDSTQQEQSTTPSASHSKTRTDLPSSIHVIDANTFRVDESYDIIWDVLLTILIRNYNIAFVNQESGIITTDWDSVFLKERTIRNKITIKIKKLSFKNTEIVFHNSVEKLTITSSYNWGPETDTYGEVSRIMNNVAIMLNQPPVKISQQNEGEALKVFTR